MVSIVKKANGAPGCGDDIVGHNRDYYDGLSQGQDDYWRFMAAPRFRVNTIAGLVKRDRRKRVVDLGCGSGALLDEISGRAQVDRTAGVDLSELLIARNRRDCPQRSWLAANLDQMVTWPAEWVHGFDGIVCSEVIEHVSDPIVLLDNAYTLAAPGGRLYLSTQSGPVRDTERRVGHVQHFHANELRRYLHQAGWKPIRIWNTGFPFHDLSKWYANRNVDACMSRFGDNAYGLREKAICWALRQAFRFNSQHRGAQLFAIAQRG